VRCRRPSAGVSSLPENKVGRPCCGSVKAFKGYTLRTYDDSTPYVSYARRNSTTSRASRVASSLSGWRRLGLKAAALARRSPFADNHGLMSSDIKSVVLANYGISRVALQSKSDEVRVAGNIVRFYTLTVRSLVTGSDLERFRFGQKTQTHHFRGARGPTIARSSTCLPLRCGPYLLPMRGHDSGGMTPGLEAPTGVYHELRRCGPSTAPYVSGGFRPIRDGPIRCHTTMRLCRSAVSSSKRSMRSG
jgi:hypothetical protein